MLAFVPAQALAGDPVAGQQVFRTCVACHNADTERNKVGPHLVDIIGRTPGTVEGFRYSAAMIGFGEAGNVWDKETIGAYLADPRGFIRGNRMAFAGLRTRRDIDNVIAYLARFSQTPADASGGEGAADGR